MTIRVDIREEGARAAAAGYFRHQLGQGRCLAKCLGEALDFEGGSCTALSAVELGSGEIADYERGHARRTGSAPQGITIAGKVREACPTPRADEQLADAIYGLLGGRADLCLLENSIARAGDRWLARAKSCLLSHGDDVLHAISGANRDRAAIVDAIREAERPPVFVGAVGRAPWPLGVDIATGRTLSSEELSAFAKTVRCVFVGAYDGEGYLVWTAGD